MKDKKERYKNCAHKNALEVHCQYCKAQGYICDSCNQCFLLSWTPVEQLHQV